MALCGGPLHFFLHLAPGIFVQIEERRIYADGLLAWITVNALRARIPGDHMSGHIQQKKRVILHPRRTRVSVASRRAGLVLQHQDMAHWQHISSKRVLDVSWTSVHTHQLKRPVLLA